MNYRTRGNTSPQGKPRVYFTGHPADVRQYFESLTDSILKASNCAVFYDADPERPEDAENFISDLDRMQLVVLVVTSRYVYRDTFAHHTVFRHALERHIPVLPVLAENGIERDLDKKCGDLQYLDVNAQDDTTMSFENKLKKFLNRVLVGDELAARVRMAFDAYVFLSYRKKDRHHAQQLMQLIHQEPFCRDLAIWYDEFLIPGENFNDAIRDALEKSELFALVVTPNLLEDSNYIMSTEYPAAVESGKPILPAMLVPTNGRKLAARYKGIPAPVDPDEKGVLAAALRGTLPSMTELGNDNAPQHLYLIGLAYLNGIDVEVNYSLAVQLITRAAEASLPEAIEALVSIYRAGEGVERDYHTAIRWQEKLIETRHASYEAVPTEDAGRQWFDALWELSDFWHELGQLEQADKVCHEMLDTGRTLDAAHQVRWTQRNLSISYDRLGDISQERRDLAGARAFYEKGFAINERLAAEKGTAQAWQDLAISYRNLGEISQAQGDLAGARAFCEKGLAINERLASEPGGGDVRRDLAASYRQLGGISSAQGDLAGAKAFYEKSLAISEQLAAEAGTASALRTLSVTYNNLGDACCAQGDLAGAKAFHEKSLVIRERLAAETGTAEAQRDLAVGYATLGQVKNMQGDLAGAEVFYEKSLAIFEQLEAETGTVEERRNMSIAYGSLGQVREAQGDLAGARVLYEKSLAIFEQLGAETGTVEERRDLSINYNKLGDICLAQGDLAGARTFYEKGLAIRERLAADTDNVEARRDLAVSYARLGHISRTQGDLDGAKAFFEKGLAISERLTADADNVEARLDLANSYIYLGDISRAQDDLDGAAAFYKKSLAVGEPLAAETNTAEVQRSLAISYSKLGDISNAQGDLVGAKIIYRMGLGIFEKLAAETGTVQARRDLAVSYDRVGEISQAQGDLTGARGLYEKNLALREQLAAQTETIEEYDDLAVSCYKMAMFVNTAQEQQGYLSKAEMIWSRLVVQCPDVPLFRERLAIVRRFLWSRPV